MKYNQIIQGECLEVMKEFPDNSVDTIITDPPYGLKFMGKKWDYNVPSIEIWKECLRIIKPGGTLLCFAGTRTQHRMAINIEDAGFILKDTIMWLYGSGFPKAADISKQIDKDECRKRLEEKLKRKPTREEFKKAWNSYRKTIGTKQHQYPDSPHLGTYKKVNISSDGIFQSENKNTNLSAIPITRPEAAKAILWNGWKSHGLKPAYEPIIMAIKPNEGSYTNNALKWGVAGLNIDGGRIKTNEIKKADSIQSDKGYWHNAKGNVPRHNGNGTSNIKGRYPANIILDEEAGKMLDKQSGILHGHGSKKHKGSDSSFFGNGKEKEMIENGGDKGGASRFFYCAKASKSEKDRGCKKNHHPTVKPLSLMKYLVTLTKMPNPDQIYLDPFCGGGTTLMACKGAGRDYIGIEKDKEYCEIARMRIKAIPESLFLKTINY